MNQFYKEVQKFRPIYFTITDIVYSLSQLAESYSEFLREIIDLELLKGNIELEKEDLKLVNQSVNGENIKEIVKRRTELDDCRISGEYRNKKIYTNKQIKDIAKRIWYQSSRR